MQLLSRISSGTLSGSRSTFKFIFNGTVAVWKINYKFVSVNYSAETRMVRSLQVSKSYFNFIVQHEETRVINETKCLIISGDTL